ncbi:hypothetical protein ACA910_021297 [Epithemia clementina (nom. ined.)]
MFHWQRHRVLFVVICLFWSCCCFCADASGVTKESVVPVKASATEATAAVSGNNAPSFSPSTLTLVAAPFASVQKAEVVSSFTCGWWQQRRLRLLEPPLNLLLRCTSLAAPQNRCHDAQNDRQQCTDFMLSEQSKSPTRRAARHAVSRSPWVALFTGLSGGGGSHGIDLRSSGGGGDGGSSPRWGRSLHGGAGAAGRRLVPSSLALLWPPKLLSLQPPGRLAVAAVVLVTGKLVSSKSVRRAAYFWWHAGPIVAHYQWTQFWLRRVVHADLPTRQATYEALHNRYAEPSLQLILHLKGLYCKLGQVLSTRPDFVPPQYIVRFATVQDAIPQWPIGQIEQIVRTSLTRYLGLEYDDVFESMDAKALGSASIGQVHAATLTPEWAHRLQLVNTNKNSHKRNVAIKVMHPGAKERFAHDCQVVRWLCRIAMPGWKQILDTFEKRLMLEFDYHREARDMEEIRCNLLDSPYDASVVCVPRPELELCCENVLVMQLLDGIKLVDAIQEGLARAMGGDREKAAAFIQEQQDQILWAQEQQDKMDASSDATNTLTGTDNRRRQSIKVLHNYGLSGVMKMSFLQRRYQKLVRLLLGVHGYQIFVNGCYNGDPHPGNCLELRDGRIGLIDYGQVRRLTDQERLKAARVVCALANGESNAVVAKYMREFGFQTKKNDDDETLARFARLFFDSDYESKALGFATPQLWFAHLMARNPLINIPEASVFIGRSSFLFRGLAKGVHMPPIRTALFWHENAQKAIDELSAKFTEESSPKEAKSPEYKVVVVPDKKSLAF